MEVVIGCNHILGRIANVGSDRRRCMFCRESFPAEGTYEVEQLGGVLESYPRSLFSRWSDNDIRRHLSLSKGDIILHRWGSESLYIFRGGGKD